MRCDSCKNEMTSNHTNTCNQKDISFNGEKLATIPFGKEKRYKTARCHDCNVAVGGIHHPGCDLEECPKCHRQLIGCDCLKVN